MRDFLHRHVLHNLGLKLISLALAVGLWLAVARDPVAEVAVDVAIEFHNIPKIWRSVRKIFPGRRSGFAGRSAWFTACVLPTFMRKSN